MSDELVEMKVQGIAKDERDQHIVILREGTGEAGEWAEEALPIVVGPFEARAIHMELQGFEPPRPMSHDLIMNVLDGLDAQITKVVVAELREEIFYAVLHLWRGGETYEIDSRPSDAIALALKAHAPIYVARKVAEQATVPVDDQAQDEQAQDEHRRLRDLLQGIEPPEEDEEE